jgi:hypothetical protein
MINERSNAILKMKNFLDIISPFNKNRPFDCIVSIDSLMKILNKIWANYLKKSLKKSLIKSFKSKIIKHVHYRLGCWFHMKINTILIWYV